MSEEAEGGGGDNSRRTVGGNVSVEEAIEANGWK